MNSSRLNTQPCGVPIVRIRAEEIWVIDVMTRTVTLNEKVEEELERKEDTENERELVRKGNIEEPEIPKRWEWVMKEVPWT